MFDLSCRCYLTMDSRWMYTYNFLSCTSQSTHVMYGAVMSFHRAALTAAGISCTCFWLQALSQHCTSAAATLTTRNLGALQAS
jgi:hypothetical protein